MSFELQHFSVKGKCTYVVYVSDHSPLMLLIERVVGLELLKNHPSDLLKGTSGLVVLTPANQCSVLGKLARHMLRWLLLCPLSEVWSPRISISKS